MVNNPPSLKCHNGVGRLPIALVNYGTPKGRGSRCHFLGFYGLDLDPDLGEFVPGLTTQQKLTEARIKVQPINPRKFHLDAPPWGVP